MIKKFLLFVFWTCILFLGFTIWFDKAYAINTLTSQGWLVLKSSAIVNQGITFSFFTFVLSYLLGVLFLLKPKEKLQITDQTSLEIPKQIKQEEIKILPSLEMAPVSIPALPELNEKEELKDKPVNISDLYKQEPKIKDDITPPIISTEEELKITPISNDYKNKVEDTQFDIAVGSDLSPIMNSLSSPNKNNEAAEVLPATFDSNPIETTDFDSDSFSFDPNAPIDFDSFDSVPAAPIAPVFQTEPETKLSDKVFNAPELDSGKIQSDDASYFATDSLLEKIKNEAISANISERVAPKLSDIKLSLWGTNDQTLYLGLTFSNSGLFHEIDDGKKWESDSGLVVKSPVVVLKEIIEKINNIAKDALEDESGIDIEAFLYLENAEVENISELKTKWDQSGLEVISDKMQELTSLSDYFESIKSEKVIDESFDSFIDAVSDYLQQM